MGHQHRGTDLDGGLDGVAASWGWSCCGKAVLTPPACPGLHTHVHTQVHRRALLPLLKPLARLLSQTRFNYAAELVTTGSSRGQELSKT